MRPASSDEHLLDARQAVRGHEHVLGVQQLVRVELVRRFLSTLILIGACPTYLMEIVFAAGNSVTAADVKRKTAPEPGENGQASDVSTKGTPKVILQPEEAWEIREGPPQVMVEEEKKPKQESLDLAGKDTASSGGTRREKG